MHPIRVIEAHGKLCPLSFHGSKGDACVADRCMAWRYVYEARALTLGGQPETRVDVLRPRGPDDKPVSDSVAQGVCLAMPYTNLNLAIGRTGP